MKRFLETLGSKNKIHGVGLRVLEAFQHIRLIVRLPCMMVLAAKFPCLKTLDIISERPYWEEGVLLRILKETFPATCPLQMPMLETVNYVSINTRDFPFVVWSRDDDQCGLKQMKDFYHFHTPRQLRLFGDTIAPQMRNSMQVIHIRLDGAAMADELLRFKNLVKIRLLSDGGDLGDLPASAIDTLREKRDCG